MRSTVAFHPMRREVFDFVGSSGTTLSGRLDLPDERARGAVLMAHCFTCTKDVHTQTRLSRALVEAGYATMRFDFTGLGGSDGDFAATTVSSNLGDLRRAAMALIQRGVGPCGLLGHSLGGAIALSAVARRPAVRAVVAESTFPTYRGVAAATVPWLSWLVPWLVSEGEDPVDALPKIPPRPLLVIHGTEDHIVDYELGASLFEAALEPKRFHRAKGADHFTPWVYEGEAFEGMLTEFFAEALR